MHTEQTETGISTKALEVITTIGKAIKKSPTGVTFIAINGYTNSSGEVSNNVINIGQKYANAVEKDIETLRDLDLTTFESSIDKLLLAEARTELINAFLKPDKAKSDGQKDAYTHIVGGLKVHNVSGELYISGFRKSKDVLIEGNYPPAAKNPQRLTPAKNELRKLLRTDKFVNMKLVSTDTLKANGETLEF